MSMSMAGATAVCPVCSLKAPVANLHCSLLCRACSAFFYRYAKESRVFICKNNPRACAQNAMQTVSGFHTCKKCRFERCLQEGMRINALKHIDHDLTRVNVGRVDARLPLISQTVAALREMRQRIDQTKSQVLMGTSEPGTRYLTTKSAADAFIVNTHHFRLLLDRLPVICNLSNSNKEYFFKKTFGFNYMLMMGLNNAHMLDTSKFFIHENMYVDLNESKMLQFAFTFSNERGDFHYENYLIVARFLLNHFRSVKSNIVDNIADSMKTEEDIAAFIVLIMIHANNFDVDPAKLYLQQEVDQLKAVWKELDLYYGSTLRESSTWGNLLLFLSNIQTANVEYMKVVNVVNERMKRAVHYRLTED